MAEKMAYTPGPWIWRGKSGSLHRVGDPPYQFGKAVLSPYYEYDSGPDVHVSESDADLIAAAPQLLEALQGVLADIADYERVNNFAPNPGRTECWDSVARAKAVIAAVVSEEVK